MRAARLADALALLVLTTLTGCFLAGLSRAADWQPGGSGWLIQRAPDDEHWRGEIGQPGMNSTVLALHQYDGSLFAGGSFTQAGNVSAFRIARWDGSRWYSVGTGADAPVRAFATFGDNLIAGGDFTQIDTPCDHIAQWDGSAWSPVGSGVNDWVMAMVVYDGKLIAAGYLTQAGEVEANFIAQWDGNTWRPLGSGLNNAVQALCVHNGCLIAGGRFTLAGELAANHIARWDGFSWAPMGDGLDWAVWTLISYDGKVIAGGDYNPAWGGMAAWDGLNWSPVGQGTDHDVLALTVYEGNLVAGGSYTRIDGVPARNIAILDGDSWSSLGSGTNDGVRAITDYEHWLVPGGYFTQAGEQDCGRIASWWCVAPGGIQEAKVASVTLRVIPNPSSSGCTVSFETRTDGLLNADVIGSSGSAIRSMLNTHHSAPGFYSLIWDGRDDDGREVPAGVYFTRVTTREGTVSGRVVVAR